MSSCLLVIDSLISILEGNKSDDNNNNNTALLLIDVQKDYYSNVPIIKSTFPNFGVNIQSLLLNTRKVCNNNAKIKIIHIRQQDIVGKSKWLPWWRELHPNDDSLAIGNDEEFCKILNNEKLFIKHSFDAFVNTELNNYLQLNAIKTLYICGLMTHACVLNTAMSAFNNGYRIYIINDCCADRSIHIHNNILTIFDGYNVNVINLKEFINSHLC
eukprot:181181_1